MELCRNLKSFSRLVLILACLFSPAHAADLVVKSLMVTNRSVEPSGDGNLTGSLTDDTNWVETSDNVFIYVRSDDAGVTVQDGTISYGHWNMEFTDNANVGVYSLSGTTATLVADGTGAAGGTNAWVNRALDTPVVITPSTTVYLFGVLTDDSATGRLNSKSQSGVTAKKVTMTYGNSLAASFDTSTATNVNNGTNELPMVVFDNSSGNPS